MSTSEIATDAVGTWIVSEGETLDFRGVDRRVAEHAADCVRTGSLSDLHELVDQALHTTRGGGWAAAHEVRDVVDGEGGLDRVLWGEVAAAVRESAGI